MLAAMQVLATKELLAGSYKSACSFTIACSYTSAFAAGPRRQVLKTLSYDTEGWGLTHDSESLIMSDGVCVTASL